MLLNASNEDFIISLISEKQELADCLRRSEVAMRSKDEELEAALAREKSLQKDAESVSSLKLELKDTQGKLRCSMDKVKKVQARADRHAEEVRELTSASAIKDNRIVRLTDEVQDLNTTAVDLNSKIARLTDEVAKLTDDLESASQKSQELLKSEIEEARAYYQGVVDETATKYYLDGKVQGRKECLEDYDIVEVESVHTSDEDTQPISDLFPSLPQEPSVVPPPESTQASEIAPCHSDDLPRETPSLIVAPDPAESPAADV